MKRSLRTIGALLKKDCKDTLRNMNVMILIFLPPLFGLLYTNIFAGMSDELAPHFVLNMVTGMTLALIPTSFLAMLVAEEKEKNTLRTLMLSGVSAAEFVISKILLTLFLIVAVSVANFFITKNSPETLIPYVFITGVGSLGLLLLGATIGLLCKDQMSTGVLSTPIALLLLLPPLLGPLNTFLSGLADITPITWVNRFYDARQAGEGLLNSNGIMGVCVMLFWMVAPGALFGLVFQKKRFDV